jgi:monofunctional glycosyltransferase
MSCARFPIGTKVSSRQPESIASPAGWLYAGRMATRRKPKRRAKKASRRKRGIVRFLVLSALCLLAVPLTLTLLYKVISPVSTLMIYDRLTDGPIAREWVPFDDIAKSLVASVVMSEDGRYCSHHGVDWRELNLVLADLDDQSRGASTIAMQTVKNLFLWSSRSYVRKAIEIPLAQYADAVLGKRRLMEIYLNIVEFGPGIFGAEAAARQFFGRSAKALSAAQSALLTATLPSPDTRDPAKPDRSLRQRARAIEAEARIAGAYIDCLYR